jgi:hypothetical protein
MITRITVRFTEDEKSLHDVLVKSAKNNRRSLNAEMLRAFEFYLKNAPEAQYEVKEVKKKPSPK